MNRIFFITLIFLGFSEATYAYTSCPNQVLTQVFSDGGTTYLGTGGLNGSIDKALPDYQVMVSIAIAAKMADKKVTIRYKEDGVVCGSAAWNEKIVGIGI